MSTTKLVYQLEFIDKEGNTTHFFSTSSRDEAFTQLRALNAAARLHGMRVDRHAHIGPGDLCVVEYVRIASDKVATNSPGTVRLFATENRQTI